MDKKERVTISNRGILIEPNQLNIKKFGDIAICRPTLGGEMRWDDLASTNLRKQYSVGSYLDRQQINQILHYQIAFFEKHFHNALQRLASRHFIEFIFDQYDSVRKVQQLYKSNTLSISDAKYWQENESIISRSLKFIAERCVLLDPAEDPACAKEFYIDHTDTVLICAEELVRLSIVSDQTHYLFPLQSKLEIFPAGQRNYYSLEITDPNLVKLITEEHNKRIELDAEIRDQFIDGKSYYMDLESHDKIIGQAFKEMCGVRYKEAIEILNTIKTMSRPSKDGFPICFMHKESLLDGLAINTKTSKESIQHIISGFMLSPNKLSSESRHFWNPRNEYRAYRRAIFEMQHPTGPHLTWSNTMFDMSLLLLVIGVSHGILPAEWKHPSLVTAIGDLSREGGHWFEQQVKVQLEKLKYEVVSSRKSFGHGAKQLELPFELDIVGYDKSTQLLLIGECKMVLGGAEPRFFRNELDNFLDKENAYAPKFREKICWTKQNLSILLEAINSSNEFKSIICPKAIAYPMITFYPSFVSYFIEDFPCVSLSEFITDHNETGGWAYEKGFESI